MSFNRSRFSRSEFSSRKTSLRVTALAGVAIFIALACISAQAAPITFDVNFQGAGWTPDSENALQYAADTWGGLLNANYAGETITINANFGSLGGGKLASTNPVRAIFGTLIPNASILFNYQFFYFPSATANHIALADLYPGEPEIDITFSPDSDHPAVTWWYDTTIAPPPPPNLPAHYDFSTIALHEIAHGLGFGSALIETSPGILHYLFTIPNTFIETGWYYDMYVFNTRYSSNDPAGFPISTDAADRYALVTDPSKLIFGGPFARAENGGIFPALYAPPPPSQNDPNAPGFVGGSSVSHLSENPDYGFPNDLMVPHAPLSEVNHSPSALDLAMLEDVGWIPISSSEIPEPGSLMLLATGTGILWLAVYRRKGK
jgi:hypothetical protein